jgi:mono/diheme cytochrome c family protein
MWTGASRSWFVPRPERSAVWPWGTLGLATALLALAPLPSLADALGARIYAERCSACHGADGSGDGPAAAALQPKPRNFRDPQFWRARPRMQIRLVVEKGRPGTMMAGFDEVLTREEIEAVVSYVMDFKTAAEGNGDASSGDGQVPAARSGQDAAGTDAGS